MSNLPSYMLNNSRIPVGSFTGERPIAFPSSKTGQPVPRVERLSGARKAAKEEIKSQALVIAYENKKASQDAAMDALGAALRGLGE